MLHSSIYSGQVERARIFLLGAMPAVFALMNLTGSPRYRTANAAAAFLAAVLACFIGVSAQNDSGEPVAYAKCTEAKSETNAVAPHITIGGYVIAQETGGVLRAMDDSKFEAIWKAELGGEFASNVAVHGESAYLVNNSVAGDDQTGGTSVLRSVNLNTGLTSRSISIPFSTRFTLYASEGGVIVLSSNGTAAMFDLELSEEVWKAHSPAKSTSVSANSENLIITAKHGGSVLFLDARSGATVTDFKTEAELTAVAILGPNTAYIGDERGNVSKINLPGGQASWTFKTGGGVSFLGVTDGSLFVASNDNFFYRISAQSGSVIWRKRMPGRMIIPPLLLAEKAFLPVFGANSVIVIETDKGKVIGRLTLRDEQFPLSSIFTATSGAVVVPVEGGFSVFDSGTCLPEK